MSLLDLDRLPAWSVRLGGSVGALADAVHAHVREMKMGALVLIGACAIGGIAAAAALAATAPRLMAADRAQRLAEQIGGDISNAALWRFAGAMDPSAQKIARRYDPGLIRPYQRSMWAEASGGFDAPPEFKLQDVSASQAMLLNAAMPFTLLPNPAARPFLLAAQSGEDASQAITCLTAAIYYEAASESDDGEAAVAQVVLNRVRHPLFPKTICGVVFQGSQLSTGCQFSFTCDGSLNRVPSPEGWARAQRIAERALNGFVLKAVGQATHYHTDWVFPYWAPSLVKLTKIGAHIFYRWSGGAGMPGAFNGVYGGDESGAWAMASAKLIRVNMTSLPEEPAPVEVAETVAVQTATLEVAPQVQIAPAVEALEAPKVLAIQPPAAPVFQTTLRHDPKPQPRLAVPSNW